MRDFHVLFLWERLNDLIVGHLIVGSPEAWSTLSSPPFPTGQRTEDTPFPLLVDFCGDSFHTMASILDTI